MPPRRFDIDWRRLSRWCWLGTFVMLVWLMAPVAHCSFLAFRDTPLSDIEDNRPSQVDRERVEKGQGFVTTMGSSIKRCYLRTPLLDQDWKSQVFLGFAAAALATTLLHRYLEGRSRTMT